MADRAIKVAVLEGDFAAICDLGLPFSLCLQLQSSDLKLCEAMWSAKSSSTGFSVSLFWPYGVSTERVKSKKKRSRRKRSKASKTNTVTNVATSPVSLNEFNGNARHSDEPVSPNKAQSTKDANYDSQLQTPVTSLALPLETSHETSARVSESDSESEIDLLSCADVIYEKQGDVHGVSYCDSSNRCGWTPVVGRRKKKTPLPEHVLRRFPPYRRAELQRVSSDSESSGPDEPLHIPQSASVEFSVHNNQPGLHVKTRNTMIWTPIASRTRARMKGTQ